MVAGLDDILGIMNIPSRCAELLRLAWMPIFFFFAVGADREARAFTKTLMQALYSVPGYIIGSSFVPAQPYLAAEH